MSAEAAADASVPAESRATATRSTLVDGVRGLAILLVALGHTSQGMEGRGLWHGSTLGQRLDLWVYSFHMPAFFFVAGLFATGSVRKRGVLRFLRDRASVLLWPYLLFGLFNMALEHLSGRTSQAAQLSWPRIAWDFVAAKEAWFLPTLYFALLVFAFLISGPLQRVPLWLWLVLSLPVRLVSLCIPVNFVAAGFFFLPFVLLGALVGRRVENVRRVPAWLAVVFVPVLVIATWLASQHGWRWHWAGSLVLAPVGILMLLLLAHLANSNIAGRALAWCGAASVSIFLVAPYPQFVTRAAMLRLHWTGSLAHLLLPTAVAAVAAGWLYHHRARFRLGWLFEFPRTTRTVSS